MKRVKPAHLVTAATLLALGCGGPGTTARAADSGATGLQAPPDDAIADTMSGALGPASPTDAPMADTSADSSAGTADTSGDTMARVEGTRSPVDTMFEGRDRVWRDAPAPPLRR